MELTYFAAGLVIGATIGALVYRNNAKKIERKMKEKLELVKREIRELRDLIDVKH